MTRASRLVAILSSVTVAACAALYGATDVPNPQDGGEDGSSGAAGSTSGASSGAGSGSASTSGSAGSGDRPSSGSSSGGTSSGSDSGTSGGNGSGTSGGSGSGSGSGSSSGGTDSSTSSGSGSRSSSGSGTGDGGNVEAAAPPDAGIGSTCGPKGTTTRCNASQVCCANLATQTNACAATCAANATLTCQVPSDCPGSAPLCCAHVTLTPDAQNDPSPKCAVTMFSAACAATCNDAPPGISCTFTGIVRLCTHDTDCASDAANALCFNFNGAPTSWCESAAAGAAGGGVEQF